MLLVIHSLSYFLCVLHIALMMLFSTSNFVSKRVVVVLFAIVCGSMQLINYYFCLCICKFLSMQSPHMQLRSQTFWYSSFLAHETDLALLSHPFLLICRHIHCTNTHISAKRASQLAPKPFKIKQIQLNSSDLTSKSFEFDERQVFISVKFLRITSAPFQHGRYRPCRC